MKPTTAKPLTHQPQPDPKQPGAHHVSSVALSCWNAFRFAQIMVADERLILEILQTYWDSGDVDAAYVSRGCRFLLERGFLQVVEGGYRPTTSVQLPGSGRLVASELVRTKGMTDLAIHPAVRYSRGAEFAGRGHNGSHEPSKNPTAHTPDPVGARMRRGRGGR